MRTIEQIQRKFNKIDKIFMNYNDPKNWVGLNDEARQDMTKKLDFYYEQWKLLYWVLH